MSDLPPNIQKLLDAAPNSGPHLSKEADRRIREAIRVRLEAEAKTRPELRRRLKRRPTALYTMAAAFAAIVLFALVRWMGKEGPRPPLLPEPEPVATYHRGISYNYSAGVAVNPLGRCDEGSFWTMGTFVPATPSRPMIEDVLPGTLSIVSCPVARTQSYYMVGMGHNHIGIAYTGGRGYPSMPALFFRFSVRDAASPDRFANTFLESATMDLAGVFEDGSLAYLPPFAVDDAGNGRYRMDFRYDLELLQRIRPGTTIPTTRFLEDRVDAPGAFYVTSVSSWQREGARIEGVMVRCAQSNEPGRVALFGFMSPRPVEPVPSEHPTRGLLEVFRSIGIEGRTAAQGEVRHCRMEHRALSPEVADAYDRLEAALRSP